MKYTLFLILSGLFTIQLYSQSVDTLYLWPGVVPGESSPKAAPVLSSDTSRQVTRIAEVTDPVILTYRPAPDKNNGAGVVVCPGGGYNILAIDLEGYEIAAWLNTMGYTAFVLEYRVPRKREGALQDIQRAIRIIRSRSKEWNLDPGKLGVLGFSAGGSLAARAETHYNERTYPSVDAADSLSCRPDFALLIYPAYLDEGPGGSLTPGLHVDVHTPPTFIFSTADDHYSHSALVMAEALREAQVPVEMHLMPKGGHGYGLRKGNPAAELWPRLAATWMFQTIKDIADHEIKPQK